MTGRGPDRQPRKSGAQCAICGIAAGNSQQIPVHRYRLGRTHYENGQATTKAIASIGLCDRCIAEKGGPVRDYSQRRAILRHSHLRLQADEDEYEWHMHADFEPFHAHPELGPTETQKP